ncbi:hypothetical protein MFMK1_001865 [Metallumcola ferriviriculae]|uniref:Uncharacterized protein n=1 Tax=Metallumcola ferriviriculae TaxID=3039180 RepID=A0AAU0UMN1_9FIRM|nr:hypothetical protein MFMK1_001865 [Desulfitibacteraceae bacterium MK1]
MPVSQFLVIQALLFGLFAVSIYLVGGAQGVAANLLMNFLTFFIGGWVITTILKSRQHLIATVLAATLSFNLVTYLLSIGLGAPIPSTIQLSGDFVVVILFSVSGMYTRLRMEAHKDNKQ